MIPRRDPDTRPQAAAVQLIKTGQADPYGVREGYRGHRADPKLRPMATRNGLPVRGYRYRGSGESMTEKEAERCLSGG